jgi:hypothetical protein
MLALHELNKTIDHFPEGLKRLDMCVAWGVLTNYAGGGVNFFPELTAESEEQKGVCAYGCG